MTDAPPATEALYQELILEHNRKPRNFREMAGADRTIEGRNPLCGDALTLWVKLGAAGDTIDDVSFKGQGCAISKASASLMTTAIKGKSRADAEALFEKFRRLVRGELNEAEQRELGSLRAFAGVARFPMRVKCASLAWHALHSALASHGEAAVSTENEGPAGPPLEGA
ncbi:MAG: Fe-S cluster assembly sulfur transfer protein SufU [Gemmatimonadales bacterium]